MQRVWLQMSFLVFFFKAAGKQELFLPGNEPMMRMIVCPDEDKATTQEAVAPNTAEVKVRPDDQLDLSPEELEKEVPPRVLYPLNPRRCACMRTLLLCRLQEKHLSRVPSKPLLLSTVSCSLAGRRTTRPSTPSKSNTVADWRRHSEEFRCPV